MFLAGSREVLDLAMPGVNMRATSLWFLGLSVLAACGEEEAGPAELSAEANTSSAAVTAVQGGLTSHFVSWLNANGYSGYGFARTDLVGGSYGGRTSAGQSVVNQPVIFIHGNSDRAVGGTFGGWSDSLDYFLANGYTSAELYATTWGDASSAYAAYQQHDEANVMHVRKFIEAVLAYTGAAKVDIVSHSMGVTLARKAVKGGSAYDADGSTYSVGSALTSRVDTFVGIAGANLGLVSCYQTGGTTPTCDDDTGLYPGYMLYGTVYGRSRFLNDLRSTSGYEGSYRYSIFSTVDEVIGYGDVVYYQYTSAIPAQTDSVIFSTYPYGHFGCKDLTYDYQYAMVHDHETY